MFLDIENPHSKYEYYKNLVFYRTVDSKELISC
jgi:hypothetical protein